MRASSSKAASTSKRDPEWPSWKAKRPAIWEELRIARVVVEEDATMTFRSDKIYHVVFLWLNEENVTGFDTYREGIKEPVAGLGAQYLIQAKGHSYHSLIDSQTTFSFPETGE